MPLATAGGWALKGCQGTPSAAAAAAGAAAATAAGAAAVLTPEARGAMGLTWSPCWFRF